MKLHVNFKAATKIVVCFLFLAFPLIANAGIVNNAGTLTGEDSLCVSMALLDSLGSPTAVDSTTDWMKIIIFKADGDSVFADSMMIDEGDPEVEIWKLGASGTDFNQVFTYSVSIADIDGTATGTLAARNGTYRYAIYCRDSSLKLFSPYFGEFQLVSTGTDLSPTTALTDAAALTFTVANEVNANMRYYEGADGVDAEIQSEVEDGINAATDINTIITQTDQVEGYVDGIEAKTNLLSFSGLSGGVDANVLDWNSEGLSLGSGGGNPSVNVASMGSNTVTSSAIQDGAIGAAEIAADAITSSELGGTAAKEIADSNWGAWLSTHTADSTFGGAFTTHGEVVINLDSAIGTLANGQVDDDVDVNTKTVTAGAIDDGDIDDGAIDWGGELDTAGFGLGVRSVWRDTLTTIVTQLAALLADTSQAMSANDSALVSRIVGRKVWGLETSGDDSSNATQRKTNIEMVDDSASSATNLMYAFNTQIDSLAHLDLRRLTVLDTGTSDGGAALFRHTNKQPGLRIQTSGTSAVAAFDIRNTGTGGSAIGMRVSSSGAHGVNFLTGAGGSGQYDFYFDNTGMGGGGLVLPYIVNNTATGEAVQEIKNIASDAVTSAVIQDGALDSANFASNMHRKFSALDTVLIHAPHGNNFAATATTTCNGDGIVSCTLDVRNSAGGLAGVDVGLYNTSNAFLYGDESDNNGFVYFNLDASTTYRVKAGGLPGSVHDSLPYQTLVTTSATNIRDTVPMTTHSIAAPSAANLKRLYTYELSGGLPISGVRLNAMLKPAHDSTAIPFDTSTGAVYGFNTPVTDTTQVTNANGYAHLSLPRNDFIQPKHTRWLVWATYRGNLRWGPVEINITDTDDECIQSALGIGSCP